MWWALKTHHKWHDIESGDVVILISNQYFALLGVQMGETLATWVDKRWQKGHKLPLIILDLRLRPYEKRTFFNKGVKYTRAMTWYLYYCFLVFKIMITSQITLSVVYIITYITSQNTKITKTENIAWEGNEMKYLIN